MIRVYIDKQSNYPVTSSKLKAKLIKFLTQEGIVSDAELSVSIVGRKRMLQLSQKYLKEKDSDHDVLTFPFLEGKHDFVTPPDNLIHLGDIVICYPKAIEEASRENKLIDEKVFELAVHGALHLLGKHHN